ncbi:MAG TPA: DHH family phosphoesterase, partial [Candidatus Sulfotelmatobacter sp.]|nr:DHH family phosphoesterase [Candidatus Sulfotelmatobacter sp.]
MTVATSTWPKLEEVTAKIRTVIDDAVTIGCLTHRDADADSLGSALAFAASMRALGKRTHTIVPHPVPRLLSHLPGFDTIESGGPDVDVLFTFDCANVDRFAEKKKLVESAPFVVNVDHHVSNQGFGDVNLVDPSASATGQVLYRLLRELDVPITADTATNLYAALFTDTGGFRHENTTEATLRLAAELVALGANPGWIAMKSYKSRSLSQVRLEGLAIGRMQSDLRGALVWSEVTREMFEQAGADSQESEGIIDTLQ